MPFKPNDPTNVDVTVVVQPAVDEVTEVQSKPLDTYHITDLQFRLSVNDPMATIAIVVIQRGYVEDFVFHPIAQYTKQVTLKGEPVVSAINKVVTPNNTVWMEIKQAVWKALQDEGHVPVGQVV